MFYIIIFIIQKKLINSEINKLLRKILELRELLEIEFKKKRKIWTNLFEQIIIHIMYDLRSFIL